MKRQLIKTFRALIITVILLAPCVSVADCCCRKIVGYMIIRDNLIDNIDKQAKKLIEEGWQPLGGVAASRYGQYQAMVKYEEVKE